MRAWNLWPLNVKLNPKPWQKLISVMQIQSANGTDDKDTEGQMVMYEAALVREIL